VLTELPACWDGKRWQGVHVCRQHAPGQVGPRQQACLRSQASKSEGRLAGWLAGGQQAAGLTHQVKA
jgi:hypothetical protein